MTSNQALEGSDWDLIQLCDVGHCAVHTPCCPCLVLSVHHAGHAPRFMCTMMACALCWLHCVYLHSVVCTPRCTHPVLRVHHVILPPCCTCAVLAMHCAACVLSAYMHGSLCLLPRQHVEGQKTSVNTCAIITS